MMGDFYDPREPPPFPPRNRRKQSVFSTAMEALAGGAVIALMLVGLKRLFGW